MCSQVTKKRIHNANRYVIAALSILGFALDGFHFTDVIFVIALMIWIWLPECNTWEARVLDYFQRGKEMINTQF